MPGLLDDVHIRSHFDERVPACRQAHLRCDPSNGPITPCVLSVHQATVDARVVVLMGREQIELRQAGVLDVSVDGVCPHHI